MPQVRHWSHDIDVWLLLGLWQRVGGTWEKSWHRGGSGYGREPPRKECTQFLFVIFGKLGCFDRRGASEVNEGDVIVYPPGEDVVFGYLGDEPIGLIKIVVANAPGDVFHTVLQEYMSVRMS